MPISLLAACIPARAGDLPNASRLACVERERLLSYERPPSCDRLDLKRRLHANSVSPCQIDPVDQLLDFEFDFAVLARSPETVTKANIFLIGAGQYEVVQTAEGLQVRPPEDPSLASAAETVPMLAAAIVGWPGKQWRHLHKGEKAPPLADAVTRIVALRLHGRHTTVDTGLAFEGVRPEAWGDALLFGVSMVATSSEVQACPRWKSEARLGGQLVLAGSDGGIIALHLQGKLEDTETDVLCPEEGRGPGQGLDRKTCNVGEIKFDLTWDPCPAPM